METRANYILIGTFTLLAVLGALGFFIWLASVQIDRQYATFGILFDDVSGLDPSGDVLLNGLSVGKVIGLRIFEDDPSKVFSTVEIDTATPIRSDTIAQLQTQGVTGVAYISLSGGTFGAAPLVSIEGNLPIIPSRRSSVQTLIEDAPDLLAEATGLIQQFKELTGPENQAHVTNILRNLDTMSGQLDQALTDFSAISGTVSDATAQITLFTGRLDSVGSAVETTLERADAALISAQVAFETADRTLTTSTTAIDSAGAAFSQAEIIMRDRIPDILTQVSEGTAGLKTAIADIQKRSNEALDGFAQTAQLLNARLAELEQTMLDANTAFAAVTEASDSFDTLVSGDGTLLVADARDVLADAQTAIAKIETIIIRDVPAIMADIRETVASASAAVDRVAEDVTGLTGHFEPLATGAEQTLASANTVFVQAQDSLGILDAAMVSAQSVLTSAETAFDVATVVMQTDLSPVLGDIRTASDRISIAVQDVTRDVPVIATDLRALIARADAVVAQTQGAVAASAPGFTGFAKTGLPELTRLSVEARNLVTTLNNLVRRIERDPARFLLEDRVPEYRR